MLVKAVAAVVAGVTFRASIPSILGESDIPGHSGADAVTLGEIGHLGTNPGKVGHTGYVRFGDQLDSINS